MGHKYNSWNPLNSRLPRSYDELAKIVFENRQFSAVASLNYGNHGLEAALETVNRAISQNRRIALYADYDVDGTMSCVCWIWFLRAVGFENFTHYIPDRIREGYGLNLEAIKHLIDEEGAELIITMDTGITANTEAAYCKERGVDFLCTDHHKIQPDRMPDCVVLNPKLHPQPDYQELCGCGITFVLLRRLAEEYPVPGPLWTDLLALTGMATICDVVPLNGVNHKLAKLGVEALLRSERPVLVELRNACAILDGSDEKDVGFRLGPRINAVGRLEHANEIIRAFVSEDPGQLIEFMGACNERRKKIQQHIVEGAERQASQLGAGEPLLMLGGEDWHQGVVGIAASKLVEKYWRPTWLYQRLGDICKGSARSIPGFDVTDAMLSAKDLFLKFGGHKAAGGFSFSAENEAAIRERLTEYCLKLRKTQPELWRSKISYDCELPQELTQLHLVQHLEDLKPFGHGFEEPRFLLGAQVVRKQYYKDKVTGEAKHTAVFVETGGAENKIMFFHDVLEDLPEGGEAEFLVSASKNTFRGRTNLSLIGCDYRY